MSLATIAEAEGPTLVCAARRPPRAPGPARRPPRIRWRRAGIAGVAATSRRDDRLVEPIGVDRVVDVVHRIESCGRTTIVERDASGGASPSATRPSVRPAVVPVAPAAPKIDAIESGTGSAPATVEEHPVDVDPARRACRPRRGAPSGDATRRVGSRRPGCDPVSAVPTPTGATTSSSAARTSHVSAVFGVPVAPNPRAAECSQARSWA